MRATNGTKALGKYFTKKSFLKKCSFWAKLSGMKIAAEREFKRAFLDF